MKDCWFDGYYNNDLYNTGAICFRRCSFELMNIVNGVQFGFDDSVRTLCFKNTRRSKIEIIKINLAVAILIPFKYVFI